LAFFVAEFEFMDRTKSMWAPPDRAPSTTAHTISLYPEFYKSRSWGRRPFSGFAINNGNDDDNAAIENGDGNTSSSNMSSRSGKSNWNKSGKGSAGGGGAIVLYDYDKAATCIAAAIRGFLARRRLSHYFHARYYTLVCPFSGYLFFHDNMNPKADTSWHKPRLAFPTDIQPFDAADAEHYLGEDKYSYHDINVGPIVARKGVGKKNIKRFVVGCSVGLLSTSSWNHSLGTPVAMILLRGIDACNCFRVGEVAR
jgi:hypothetical protein